MHLKLFSINFDLIPTILPITLKLSCFLRINLENCSSLLREKHLMTSGWGRVWSTWSSCCQNRWRNLLVQRRSTRYQVVYLAPKLMDFLEFLFFVILSVISSSWIVSSSLWPSKFNWNLPVKKELTLAPQSTSFTCNWIFQKIKYSTQSKQANKSSNYLS